MWWNPSFSFHACVTYAVAVIGIIGNGILISLSLRNTASYMGAYRYLILAFAASDIIIAVVTAITVPVMQTSSFGYIVFGLNTLEAPEWVGTLAMKIWWLGYNQAFLILTYQFVYRYIKVCRPSWLNFTQDWSFTRWFLICYVIYCDSQISAYFSMQGEDPTPDSRRRYGRVVDDNYGINLSTSGFIAPVIPDAGDGSDAWIRLSYTIGGWVAFFATFALNVACALAIRRALSQPAMHAKVRDMQAQLLKALLVQTAFPTLFSYLPMLLILVFPALGIEVSSSGSTLCMIAGIFPAVDPFLIIYFVTGFRKAVIDRLSFYRTGRVDRIQSILSTVSSQQTRSSIPDGTVATFPASPAIVVS